MAFKKGRSGNPEGRPQGSKNKVTTELRERIKTLLDNEMENLETTLKKLSAKDRIDVFIRLSEFVLPKLQRSEVRNLTTLEELLEMPREERLRKMADIKRQLDNEK